MATSDERKAMQCSVFYLYKRVTSARWNVWILSRQDLARICEAISEKPEEFPATPKMSAIANATDAVTEFTRLNQYVGHCPMGSPNRKSLADPVLIFPPDVLSTSFLGKR